MHQVGKHYNTGSYKYTLHPLLINEALKLAKLHRHLKKVRANFSDPLSHDKNCVMVTVYKEDFNNYYDKINVNAVTVLMNSKKWSSNFETILISGICLNLAWTWRSYGVRETTSCNREAVYTTWCNRIYFITFFLSFVLYLSVSGTSEISSVHHTPFSTTTYTNWCSWQNRVHHLVWQIHQLIQLCLPFSITVYINWTISLDPSVYPTLYRCIHQLALPFTLIGTTSSNSWQRRAHYLIWQGIQLYPTVYTSLYNRLHQLGHPYPPVDETVYTTSSNLVHHLLQPWISYIYILYSWCCLFFIFLCYCYI